MWFGLLILGVFNTCFRGAIVSIFWRWFVLSKFDGLPSLSLASAIGLSMFIGALVPGHKSMSDQEIEESYKDTAYRDLVSGYHHSIALLIGLIAGWVVHLFL